MASLPAASRHERSSPIGSPQGDHLHAPARLDSSVDRRSALNPQAVAGLHGAPKSPNFTLSRAALVALASTPRPLLVQPAPPQFWRDAPSGCLAPRSSNFLCIIAPQPLTFNLRSSGTPKQSINQDYCILPCSRLQHYRNLWPPILDGDSA